MLSVYVLLFIVIYLKSINDVCVAFSFIGEDAHSLYVQYLAENTTHYLWHMALPQEEKWFTTEVDIFPESQGQVTFTAYFHEVNGDIDYGEIGIDDINVDSEPCEIKGK